MSANFQNERESDDAGESFPKRVAVFATTHWSIVLAAGAAASPEADRALARLCETYWYVLYAHVRRRGFSKEDAEDHTQGFLAHLMERNAMQRVSPAKGRFRSFLLASLNYYLSDAHDRITAQKRGGGYEIISFDAQGAERRYAHEPANEQSPDKIFERRWALALLDKVLTRLKNDFADAGKSRHFERLSGYLSDHRGLGSYAEAARDLGLTEDAVKKAVQRMRLRYGELFREEVAQTVATKEEIDEELRYLRQVVGRPAHD